MQLTCDVCGYSKIKHGIFEDDKWTLLCDMHRQDIVNPHYVR